MKPSPTIFTSGAPASRRSADVQLAWLDAADDVREAYLAWTDAEGPDRTAPFLVYQAALDREEAAARTLALQLRCRGARL